MLNLYQITGIFIAVYYESRTQVSLFYRLFLLRGADTSIRNKEGKMPMDVSLKIFYQSHCIGTSKTE